MKHEKKKQKKDWNLQVCLIMLKLIHEPVSWEVERNAVTDWEEFVYNFAGLYNFEP